MSGSAPVPEADESEVAVADTHGGPYEDLPDGVLVTDATGLVTDANATALRMLGQSADATLGRALRDVLPLRDEHDRDWWTCTDPWGGLSTRTRQPEHRLTLPDGRALLVTAAYVRDSSSHQLQRFVVALRDDRARERVERSRADLVSTVAHELRSPLTSVKGFTATLLAKWDRFNDEQKQVMLATVNADADRVTRLLTELLDVSRIDAGRIEVRRQVVDLEAAVRRCVAGRVASGESPDRFVVDVAGQPDELWLDPDKIDQVVGNLVENALRHGEGTVTVRIAPSDELGAGGAELTVSDEGKGIPPEAAARVFRKFWRGDRRGGTGLGLYIVKGMIEAHGGRVEVRSAPSGGAAFVLVLPAGTPSFL